MRKLTQSELEAFNYLNDLRESGQTNMFGAPPYLVEQFDIPKSEAMRLTSLWMNNFHSDKEAYKSLLIKS